ncbi:TPA: hypothetical protein I8370_004032 [Klebsiella oxytoca]|uniref:hypothetical protein n=1 Tax=Klebsiella oxytoca TaxID=571 RepID=UPI001A1FF4F0|nr:hypothetical protein [Klebsiella oxytoca]MCE5366987.1 hypothetical protein [Klebsiella oxytoca]HAT2830955.1 hypothetical protein [Klebsiella oxytoca]HBM2922470.1 hypothetical protein [Klebsiella oxytoca]HCD9002971.1 hypothetical protein [Klebsiella oxytoca]
MAKKKRQSKSARALKRRIARLEEQVSALSDGGKVVSGWKLGGYTSSLADSEDAVCAVLTATEKTSDSALTREAYHQKKDSISLRAAVIHGVQRAVSMFK